MKIINTEEIEKLNSMYSGDSSRDASSSIRGFIFQDLIALYYLADKKTDFICMEYLEDLDVFCTDGTVKIMQIKYYPKTSPNRKEIMSDLYYQYLRFEILGCALKAIPMLAIYRHTCPQKATLKEMQDDFIGIKRDSKPAKIAKPTEWMKSNVYCKKTKQEQKKILFENAAYDESIMNFLGAFDIKHFVDKISDFKTKVAREIDEQIDNKGVFVEEEIRQRVLIGLAINYIQQRYNDDNEKRGLNDFQCKRQDFLEFLTAQLQAKSDICIAAYLSDLVYECYLDIVNNNEEMTEEQCEMLQVIIRNTQAWLRELVNDVDGQFRLINTVSFQNNDKLKGFRGADVNSRYEKIIAHEENIRSYLLYLWKFMMNLNKNLLGCKIDDSVERLTPQYYIDRDKSEYICMKFEGDCVDSSIILPEIEGGRERQKYDDIYSRMYELKPRKWYMRGSKKGDFEYTFNVADTGDGTSVLDVGKDGYKIECMECIGIDKGQWSVLEECDKCVFLTQCVREKGL